MWFFSWKSLFAVLAADNQMGAVARELDSAVERQGAKYRITVA